jgi:hypothetical protein
MAEKKKMLPRHAAGQFHLKSGTGAIITLIPVGDFLELYKVDRTFRMEMPETLDPEETVPDMPSVISEIPDVGSGNPIVARVFIQAAEALKDKKFKTKIDAKRVTVLMHSCKEDILVCETTLKKLLPEYEAIVQKIEKRELQKDGRALNPFPMIPSLESNASLFLTSAKRALQRIIDVFCEFYGTEITNPRFDKAIEFLSRQRSDFKDYIGFLKENETSVCKILDLRNYQEHPTKSKKTTISNFRLTPKGIRPPSWNVTGVPETGLIQEMKAIINFLIEFAETNFLYCLLDNLDGWVPYQVTEIPEEGRSKDCPVRYKVEIAWQSFLGRPPSGNESGNQPQAH